MARYTGPSCKLCRREKQKLLVIHNIDAISEKVRAAINNLMLNGFVEIPGEGKYYLPDFEHVDDFPEILRATQIMRIT